MNAHRSLGSPFVDKPALLMQTPPPIYGGSVMLHDWKYTARTGMSVDFGIRDISPSDLHPFKGLLTGKEYGQRMKVWIGPSTDASILSRDHPGAIYGGDAILMRWSDDSSSGMTVKVVLDPGPDGTDGKHPLEGYAIGRKEGEVLTFVAWALSEDERILHPSHTRKKMRFGELTSVKQANILCRDAKFVSFLASREAEFLEGELCEIRPEGDPTEFASRVVRGFLKVDSRAVLNYDNHQGALARRRWESLIRLYFASEQYRRRW